jgi:phosphoribosylglycinamide formyltransferase-1
MMFCNSLNGNNFGPRLAVFASGNGSNAQRLAEFFHADGSANVAVIYSNKPDAYVLDRARLLGIPSVVFNRHTFYETQDVLSDLHSRSADWIVLAGFLWLMPSYLLEAYKGRIVNIHPALLPKYGGKGMYGMKVHEAVIAAGETESGITIHLVNENYDEGKVIFQARCTVEPHDTPESLAQKIHELEYEYFPQVIKNLIKKGA